MVSGGWGIFDRRWRVLGAWRRRQRQGRRRLWVRRAV